MRRTWFAKAKITRELLARPFRSLSPQIHRDSCALGRIANRQKLQRFGDGQRQTLEVWRPRKRAAIDGCTPALALGL
jgi:hypothetical protein